MLFDKPASPGPASEEIGRSRAGLRSAARASSRYAMPPLVPRNVVEDAAWRHTRNAPPPASLDMEDLVPVGSENEDAWLNDLPPLRAKPEARSDTSSNSQASAQEDAAPAPFIVAQEWLEYGPLGVFLQDESVSEILVIGQQMTLIERNGDTMEVACYFEDERHLSRIIQVMQRTSGIDADDKTPLVHAQLPGEVRATIVLPPYAVRGPILFIAKPPRRILTVSSLVESGMLPQALADYLADAMQARLNIAICGALRSGRTTLLNALAGSIAEDERIVTVEESAALSLAHKHVAALELHPHEQSAKTRVTMRELLASALSMRPERLLVDGCQGNEMGELLSALHAGHDGACFTLYATGVEDCLERLETTWLAQQPGTPPGLARAQFARMLHLVIFLARLPDGSRSIARVAEVQGIEEDQIRVQDMFINQRAAREAV